MNGNNYLKQMSNSVKTAYSNYLVNPKNAKMNLSKVALPSEVKKTFFNYIKKLGGVFYGTIVTVNNVSKTRKTSDLDCYLPKAKMFKLLEMLDKKYGDKIRYSKRHFGIIKVEYKYGGKWIEIADVGELESAKKVGNKSVITDNPFKIYTENALLTNYSGAKGQTLEVQHQRKINGTKFSQSNPVAKSKRFGKDAYDMGVLNRYTIGKMIDVYCKTKDKTLKREITKFLKSIVFYSTTKEVQKARLDFEKACIKNKLCYYRLFDGKHNAQLEKIKMKLKKGTFDLDKDLKIVRKSITPTKY